jgi:hypothetical protein
MLETLKAQGAPLRAVAAAEMLTAARERIPQERYNAQREREELDRAAAAALDDLVAAVAETDAAIDAERDAELANAAAAHAQRAQDHRSLADVVDTVQLRGSDDPLEIERLVGDAQAVGDVVGAEARRLAVVRLKSLAADDTRVHRLNSPAFAVLCRLTTDARIYAAGTRSEIVARHEQRKREARQQVLDVGRALGLDASLRARLARPATPATTGVMEARPTFVIGPAWERMAKEQGR